MNNKKGEGANIPFCNNKQRETGSSNLLNFQNILNNQVFRKVLGI